MELAGLAGVWRRAGGGAGVRVVQRRGERAGRDPVVHRDTGNAGSRARRGLPSVGEPDPLFGNGPRGIEHAGARPAPEPFGPAGRVGGDGGAGALVLHRAGASPGGGG